MRLRTATPPVLPGILALLTTITTTFASASPALAAVARQTTLAALSGTLAFLPDEPPLTFHYSTPDANDTNWVGIYHASGGGPENEAFVAESLDWAYAPASEGEVRLSATGLQPGAYRVFLLRRDGYSWLAAPVNVTVPHAEGPVAFIVSKITARNARVGDAYEASVAGLRSRGGNSTVVYEKVSGDAWVKVSADGVLSGVPDTHAPAQTTVTVGVTASADGSSAHLSVTIPTRAAGAPLVDELAVMSYNLWHGGTRVAGYHEKQVRFLASSGADVVGFQESTGGHATRLGDALGWFSWQGEGVGVVSKYPISEAAPHESWAGRVRITPGSDDDGGGERSRAVNLWNVHLGHNPYGPYDFCFDDMAVDEVLAREAASGRTPQVVSVVAAMRAHLEAADDVPVVLVGDFNAPSHLDWTDAARDAHCGRADVPWPTSVEPAAAGLVDSYRVVHPDPVEDPGVTWSPIFLENEGRPEPMDRIDFVYYRSRRLEVVSSSSLVVGEPRPQPDHGENEWTSDHAAVLSVFSFRD
ncbi:endonuclease/exonuclease/phosphatase family [Colletotrichum higginsianum]|uniref:Endonuclease/exonuclease/phosphatase domain-containing protein n=1 Tax=Colletotrichum higginsianum TaxID=80884 RepID=A0A4T0VFW3_9PEZI|nr:Uncharacterized protein CH35J_011921 [Colletotrichum higginsianum]GJD04132.1 endonuclease/exonuclease/phosphatase family [Colletotrichum higginsianum]